MVLDKNYSKFDWQQLSKREKEVLALIANGEGTKQMADILCISPNTVQRHRQNIMQHLKVSNCTEVVQLALCMGLLNNLNICS